MVEDKKLSTSTVLIVPYSACDAHTDSKPFKNHKKLWGKDPKNMSKLRTVSLFLGCKADRRTPVLVWKPFLITMNVLGMVGKRPRRCNSDSIRHLSSPHMNKRKAKESLAADLFSGKD